MHRGTFEIKTTIVCHSGLAQLIQTIRSKTWGEPQQVTTCKSVTTVIQQKIKQSACFETNYNKRSGKGSQYPQVVCGIKTPSDGLIQTI